MINYVTKYDVSQYQLVATAAIMKCALENAKSVTDFFKSQLRIWNQDMNKFVLQFFNHLTIDCEINDSQAASCLLDLSDCYMLFMMICHLNLCQIQFCFENIIMKKSQVLEEEDELARVTCARMTLMNLLDHYY